MVSMVTPPRFPPPLVHELRSRSFAHLYRMTGNPGNRGFGRLLRQRIQLIAQRERYPIEKAITISYLGSYLADHIVFAEKEAVRLIDGRVLTEREEHEIWERNYPHIIARLLAEMPDGDRVGAELVRLERFTKLPPRLFAFRSRHWGVVQGVLQSTLADMGGNISEIPVVTRIHDLLASVRSPAQKALGICFAASLLADMECWVSHFSWSDAYQKVMTELYPLLHRYPEVLEAIVRIE